VKKLGGYSASLEKKNVQPGEENSAVLSLPADRQGKEYSVIGKAGIYSKRVDAAADSIAFAVPSAAGTQQVYVAGEGGGFYHLEYAIGANRSIKIDKFEIVGELTEGEAAQALATISAQSYPAEVELEFSIGSQSKKFSATISAATELEIGFTPKEAGAATAKLVARSGGAEDEKSAVADVQEAPQIVEQPAQAKPAAPPAQQSQPPQSACPLPLAILMVSFVAIATKR